MLQKWNEKYEWPKLRTAVASEFFKTVESQYADRIETVRGAWPDWWTDGFASGAREAAISRVTHSDIIANQAGLSFAKILGAQLPTDINDRIYDINKALLFYDEHTFGHSESVRNAYGLENLGNKRSLKTNRMRGKPIAIPVCWERPLWVYYNRSCPKATFRLSLYSIRSTGVIAVSLKLMSIIRFFRKTRLSRSWMRLAT